MPSIVAGIEMGGTGCRVAISNDQGQFDEKFSLQLMTSSPEETLSQMFNWLKSKRAERSFVALGIACFGPIDLNKKSSTYGFITTTPKPGWQYVDVVGSFKNLQVPIIFETDVNAPALTESKLRNDPSLAYITVGTGVGLGLVIYSQPIHGLMHPEGAHIKPQLYVDDDYLGCCPFHRTCIEGMACAKAVADRLNIHPLTLHLVDHDHPVWKIQTYYIAQLCVAILCLTSVQRIVIGGGLMKRKNLFIYIRQHVQDILNGYINVPAITKNMDELIVPSKLDDLIGIQSAIDLAESIVEN